MTTKDDALKLALEALKGGLWDYGPEQDEHQRCNEVIAICEAALAEQPKLILDAYRIETEFFGLDENAKDHPNSVALYRLAEQPAQQCNPHPKAPHGFDRNASHSADRYVCECEGWDSYEAGYQAGIEKALELDADPQPAQQQEPEPVAGKPLPCPFCGNSGLDFYEGSTYRWGIASCSGCGASCGEIRREYPDKGEWHKEAIAEWNRRTSPPASKPWVGLTDEEIDECYYWKDRQWTTDELVRYVEAKLREKNA